MAPMLAPGPQAEPAELVAALAPHVDTSAALLDRGLAVGALARVGMNPTIGFEQGALVRSTFSKFISELFGQALNGITKPQVIA